MRLQNLRAKTCSFHFYFDTVFTPQQKLFIVCHVQTVVEGTLQVAKMIVLRSWLLTLQLTMVAPCRLMVQVVLLPLSMGTTGTWHAILVTPTPAAHWSSVAAAADCFYYVRLECHLVARRDTSSHPDKDPGPGPDAPHSTHTFIVSHTQTCLIMTLSFLIPL